MEISKSRVEMGKGRIVDPEGPSFYLKHGRAAGIEGAKKTVQRDAYDQLWQQANDFKVTITATGRFCLHDQASDGLLSLRTITLLYWGAMLCWGTLCVINPLALFAADRTLAYLPLSAATESTDQSPYHGNDAAILQAGVSPTEATGLAQQPSAWQGYLSLWKQHHVDPSNLNLRRFFRMPSEGVVAVADRRGRIAPRFLRWRPGDFRQIETPHFIVLSKADPEEAKQIAERLEMSYWVWTQLYFPLWNGRSQVGLAAERWQEDPSKPLSPIQGRQHRVVLLENSADYQQTIASPPVAAGTASMIAASAGFYSSNLETSFFYPQSDHASLSHELCHQLFFEASDRRRGIDPLKATELFCWVEGIAGHFESLRFGDRLASIGGWDSSRLQYARYRTLIGSQPIAMPENLSGTRDQCQARDDIANWYSQSILNTHFLLDAQTESVMPGRLGLLQTLAEIYRVQWPRDLTAEPQTVFQYQAADVQTFLQMDDAKLIEHPITDGATEIGLAGTEVGEKGWSSLPPQPMVRWFDASRTPIKTAEVERLIIRPSSLRQLSLEATQIDSSIGKILAAATNLQELDLSWTRINDDVVATLAHCPKLETLWLTGTRITDASLATLEGLTQLKTIDVQRTKLSESAISHLKSQLGESVQVNPLVIPSD